LFLTLYFAKDWTLNEDIAKRLAAFERKVLRRVFGATETNES
jgi:hypothetical protein